jgi:hypothetical protein
MRTALLLLLAIVLNMPASQARGGEIRIRTGQVGGLPGSCPGSDDTFRFYSPERLCSRPILATAFQSSHFDSACAGPQAILIDPAPFAWVPQLACDPDARWIASGELGQPGSCDGIRRSVLYCAAFNNDYGCTTADSIAVCWAVDDYLGDPAGFPGPNPGGVYLNGVDLGPAFSGLGAAQQQTAVAYNVPINVGLNQLAVYQRDAGCGVAGLILSAVVYACEPLPVEKRTWGSIKRIFQ